MSAPLRCVLITDGDLTRAMLFPRPRASRAVVARIVKRKAKNALWASLALALGTLVVWLVCFGIQDTGLL